MNPPSRRLQVAAVGPAPGSCWFDATTQGGGQQEGYKDA
jgi:hypothetical protein